MFLKRAVILFITLIILFADSGQMIYAHTCFKSNRTSFSLYAPDNCCDEKENTKSCCAKKAAEEKENCTIGKMDCCSVSAKYVKLSFPTSEIKSPVKEVVKQVMAELNFFFAYASVSFDKILFLSSPPLPLSKADIRLTKVFRI